ncbi:iron-containing redox enzyme family protein [Xenorhabdus khoisanae]|uniref:iron-containing redox enzyme family protein n=1 Tax=Xenorhabdus khoisanae TaxID=880157 RepID=UPI002358D0AE|nr:iron-containing redox enzyme family protein [Xenorhabdus khoisanae]MDC9615400.1 iron-containing redox enzyme family protein [Xenorhabdus khoisanae]
MQTIKEVITIESLRQQIQATAESVFSHPALNNEFYTRWMSETLTLNEVMIFAKNYLARTTNTSTMVALSFLGATEMSAKVEIVKNLYSEFGYGDQKKAHLVLLHGYFEDLLSRLAGRKVKITEIERSPLLPSTEAFIVEQRALYTFSENNPPTRILGTLLAQEWLAYSMLTRLYEGARNYRQLSRAL